MHTRLIVSCALLSAAAALSFSTPAHAAKVLKNRAVLSAEASEISPEAEVGIAPGAEGAAPLLSGLSLGIFRTTGYSNPDGAASADGSMPRAGHTVSADWSVLPKGSKIRFTDSDVVYTVEDSGVHGNVIDIYYGDETSANAHGVQQKEVLLLQ